MFRFSDLSIDLLGPPAPNWRWRVAIPQLPDFDVDANFGPRFSADSGDLITGAGGAQNLPAERVSFIPIAKVPSRATYGGGRNRYFPDNNDIDPMSLTLYETSAFPVFKFFRHWKQMVLDDDGYYGVPFGRYGYKRDIHVFLYAQTTDYPTLGLKMTGAWPMDVQQLDLGQDETGRIQIVANISIDEIEPITDFARLGTTRL